MIQVPQMNNRRTNRLNDIELFLARWDDPCHPANQTSAAVRWSPHGNRNTSGRPADYFSPVLTPHEDGFWEAVEPGVRELVELIIGRGWVTYTSCEGHAYPGADLEPAERSVGLLPRNRAEQVASAATLTRAARHRGREVRPPYAVIEEGRLIDSLTLKQAPTIEIRFVRRTLEWTNYFARLDSVYGGFLASLHASVEAETEAVI
jgi:uncharacterized protein